MIIDLQEIQTEIELHNLLAEKLKFPSFYGNNWDALWDTITGLIELPTKITFTGTNELKKKLPESMTKLENIFNEMQNEYPSLSSIVKWQ